MADSLKSVITRIGDFFKNLEKKKLVLFIIIAVVIVGGGIAGAVLLNQVHYTVLYSGLDASEAGTIKTVLDGKGVNSKVEGTTIMVPEDKADTLRVELASQGYPSTGLSYNLFANSSALGSTDLERRTYKQFQLQENIRQTIRRMDKVQDCIVIVNLASESSYVISEDTTDASVAVELSLKAGATLTTAEAKAIQQLVLKSVPTLKSENMSIVDSKMHYYDVNSNGGTGSDDGAGSQQQLTEQMKETLQKQVLRVLEPSIGSGNVAVSVNLSLDFDKQTTSKVEFVPPVEGDSSGLVRSSQELYNAVASGGTGASGTAGTQSNGTGNPAYVAGATPSATSSSPANYSKTYNYELNQIQTKIDKAQGAIQNLTVAVLVNSEVKDIDSYTSTVKNLVAKAIGVKPDYISVEMMPFVKNNNVADSLKSNQQAISDLNQNKLIRTIVTVAGILAAIIVILMFFKKPAAHRGEPEPLPVAEGRLVNVTAGDVEDELQSGFAFDMADLVLKKSDEAEKIEELMERYPETVAQILRTWLAEDN